MLHFVPALADHSTRFHTAYMDERPVATLERPRVYDRAAPAFKVYALDGSHLGDAEGGFSARRICRLQAERLDAAAPDRKHTVSRSIGNRIEVTPARTLDRAAIDFVYEAQRLIEANGARDTRAGWALYHRAKRVARDIRDGVVCEAELRAYGECVAFVAGRA